MSTAGPARSHNRRDAGYVGLAMAGSLVMFCGFLGLAIDVGMIYYDKGRMQAAADSAALAGAREVLRGNYSSVTSAAQTEATTNGYTTGSDGATVTVNNPPLSGDHIGSSLYVEAIVKRSEPTFFTNVLGLNAIDVSARAVAGLETKGTCIYVLDPSGHPALSVGGGGVLNIPCAVVVNSTDSSAIVTSGGSCINATEIDVTGNYKAGCYSPTPTTGVDPSDDPLLYLTAPTAAATCDAAHTNYSLTSGTASITAGTYCATGSNAAITVKDATLNLGPGTYILKGGGLSVSKSTSTVNGTGVTIYNTCASGSCANDTTGHAPISFSGGANANLTAPTSGSYNNILFFVDRNAPAADTNTFSGGTYGLEGTVYATTQEVLFSSGSTSTALNINVVSDLLFFTGGSTLNLNHTFPGGSAIKEVEMVE